MIVDGKALRIGSSNMNNRSMRLDSECDIVVGLHGDEQISEKICSILHTLMAEHLGKTSEDVVAAFARNARLIKTIESLRGRSGLLRDYELPDMNDVEKFLADQKILDPEGQSEMFEPLTRRVGLKDRIGQWSHRRATKEH
jgi:phosphatidylserine/phosphatidylglycerophosphate/cardiolipin synthase-like enzyme